MNRRFLDNFRVALDAIGHNRLRSLLSSLGIVFGIAAVISMVAIGRGARQEILEQLKLLGANNITIKAIDRRKDGAAADTGSNGREVKRYSPGLTLGDARRIQETIPQVAGISPEIVVETQATRAGRIRPVKMVGVDPDFFILQDFALLDGYFFSARHLQQSLPVCVIGYGVKSRFFARENPLGRRIKCGDLWLTVLGVLGEKSISDKNMKMLGVRDFNMDIYIPITTMLMRSKNRQAVYTAEMNRARQRRGSRPGVDEDSYHQLDQLVVRVNDTRFMSTTAEIIGRMLKRRHNGIEDFAIVVPEVLLRQEQRTKAIFNIVLGAIASISLLVGGIGIMNIMLASVLERIHEIGIRLSVGATPDDIVQQFLCESVIISVSGGIIGTFLGAAGSFAIEWLAGIQTIVSFISIILSFAVSVGVGLLFGFMPARKASRQDPITCLRYE